MLLPSIILRKAGLSLVARQYHPCRPLRHPHTCTLGLSSHLFSSFHPTHTGPPLPCVVNLCLGILQPGRNPVDLLKVYVTKKLLIQNGL